MKNKAVYLALGITGEGTREVSGLWIADNEGAKFWLGVMNELRNRGVQDILIAVVDGLKGLPGGDHSGFSGDHGPNLHRPPGPPLPKLLLLEGSQGRRRGPARRLRRGDG